MTACTGISSPNGHWCQESLHTVKWAGGELWQAGVLTPPPKGRVTALHPLMAAVQEHKSKDARYFGFSKEAGKSLKLLTTNSTFKKRRRIQRQSKLNIYGGPHLATCYCKRSRGFV